MLVLVCILLRKSRHVDSVIAVVITIIGSCNLWDYKTVSAREAYGASDRWQTASNFDPAAFAVNSCGYCNDNIHAKNHQPYRWHCRVAEDG